MNTPSTTTPVRSRGRALLLLGVGLAIVPIAVFAAQLGLHQLTMPWYLPIATTLGVVLLLATFWQRRTVVRGLALLLLLLLAGVELVSLLGMRLPAYAGPVAAGKPFPAFTASEANGAPFTDGKLEGTQNNVLVFYRGRW